MKKQTVYLILSLLLMGNAFLAQTPQPTDKDPNTSQTNFSTQRSIRIDADSKPKEVSIKVKSDTKKLDIAILSAVTKGKIKIELYNPDGVLKGSFTIETQVSSATAEKVTGNIRKYLKQPKPGTWIIKIIPVEATGEISIRSTTIE